MFRGRRTSRCAVPGRASTTSRKLANSERKKPRVSGVGTACDQAWAILQTALLLPTGDYQRNLRGRMAARVIAAVEDGERDPDQLKAIALG